MMMKRIRTITKSQSTHNKACASAVEHTLSQRPFNSKTEGLYTALVDMLADAMHMCERRRIDFDEALQTARDHYAVETDVNNADL